MSKKQAKPKNTTGARDFGDKLSDALGLSRPQPGQESADNAPQLYQGGPYRLPERRSVRQDGVDHINCSGHADTPLGYALSFQTNEQFRHAQAGPFRSLEGFLLYIRTEDDVARGMTANAAFHARRNLNRRDIVAISDHMTLLLTLDAQWQQITNTPALAADLRDCTLPFDMYNVDSTGIRIRRRDAEVMVHALELMRIALATDLSYPDFTSLFPRNFAAGRDWYRAYCEEAKLDLNNNDEVDGLYKDWVQRIVAKHFAGLVSAPRPPRTPEFSAEKKKKPKKSDEDLLKESEARGLKAARFIVNETNRIARANRQKKQAGSETTPADIGSEITPVVGEETTTPATTMSDLSFVTAAEIEAVFTHLDETRESAPVQEAVQEQVQNTEDSTPSSSEPITAEPVQEKEEAVSNPMDSSTTNPVAISTGL